MIGRAGRRGKDKEGHIIFANVDWKYLMKSELSSIVSPYKYVPNYNILSHLSKSYNTTIDKIFKDPMDGTNIKPPEELKIYEKEFLNVIVWKLKLYDGKVIHFCNNISIINNSLTFKTNHASLKTLIKIFSEYFFNTDIESCLSKVINRTVEISASITQIINEYVYILKSIYNSIFSFNEHSLKRLSVQIKYSYETFGDILNKSCDLN